MGDKYVCISCKRAGETTTANSWCIDCNESVCEICANYHKRLAPPHNIVPNRKTTGLRSTLLQKSKYCPVHSDQKAALFCSKHDCLLCASCVAENHQQCRRLLPIEKAAEMMDRETSVADITKRTENLCKVIEDIEKQTNKQLKDLDKKKNEIIREIDDISQEICDHVKNIAAKLKKELRTKYKACKDEILDGTNLRDVVDDINALNRDMLMVHQYTTNNHIFQAVKYIDSILHRNEETFRQTLNKSSSILNFVKNPNLDDVFITNFGEIESKCVKSSLNSSLEIDTKGQFFQENKNKVPLMLLSSFQTSVLENGVDVNRGCIIGDDKMVLTERGRKHVRLCNLDGTDGQVIDLDFEPYDITDYINSQFILSGGSKGCIYFMDIFSKEPHNIIKVGKCSFSVAALHKRIWVENTYRCISEVDIKGDILKTIKLKLSPCEISVNSLGSLFITSSENNKVYSVTTDGQTHEVFAAIDLNAPTGITIDEMDYIYVAGNGSNNVHRFSCEDSKREVILKEVDGIMMPRGLCFNMKNKLLLLINRDGNSVSIYKKTQV